MKFLLGLILYLIDPKFRRLVRLKMHQRRGGTNEQVGAQEQVIAVLRRAGHYRRIIR